MIIALVIAIFVIAVIIVVAINIHERSHFARRVDGTPISYDEFDNMIRDFDRQRELLYGIPQNHPDEHGRIRDEIRRNRPRPKLTALVGLVLISVVAIAMLMLSAINSDPAIVASANQFTLVGEGWLWAGLGVALIAGVIIGAIGRAVGGSPLHTIACGILLGGLFYVATMPGMAGTGIIAVFASAVGAAFLVMALAMVPATIIMSLH